MTAEEVRQLRDRLGWTQQEMATKLQVALATVASWEQGRKSPGRRSERDLWRLQAAWEQRLKRLSQ